MNYALRNTIILAVLLILVFVGFLLGNNFSVKKLEKIKLEYENNSNTINYETNFTNNRKCIFDFKLNCTKKYQQGEN